MRATWKSAIPAECQLCHTPLKDEFLDVSIATYGGQWGTICSSCGEQHGVRLGTGLGQRYERQGEQFVKVQG